MARRRLRPATLVACTCAGCGAGFFARRKDARNCSARCRQRVSRRNRRKATQASKPKRKVVDRG